MDYGIQYSAMWQSAAAGRALPRRYALHALRPELQAPEPQGQPPRPLRAKLALLYYTCICCITTREEIETHSSDILRGCDGSDDTAVLRVLGDAT